MGVQVCVHLSWVIVILMLAIRGVVEAKVSAAGDECRPRRCSHHGPEIRFPFWIKDKQPEYCHYPGFQLFCHKGKTLLPFQYLANTSLHETLIFFSKNLSVLNINYTLQEVLVIASQFTNNLKLVSTSNSSGKVYPYYYNYYHQHYYKYETNTTFVSCSSRIKVPSDMLTSLDEVPADMLTSLDGKTFPVYCLPDFKDPSRQSITSCTKVFNSSLPYDFLQEGYGIIINWSTPNCVKCEAKGEYCMMKNRTSSNTRAADDNSTTICLPKGQRHQGSIKPIAIIIPVATLIALSFVVLLYYIIISYRRRKYDELKIEMFLTDYKAMKPTRYSYADIKKITSNFSDKLGQGGYGSVYKGQITKDIIVAVKVLKCDPKANGEDFINEVGTIGQIYHVNVVRLLGYCADGCNRALVYEFQPNHSLEKFTYSGKNQQQKDFLGLKKMQEIALGIAKGIEYLHQGCTQQILHFDIKPHNILLDQNFNPKISDFGLAKLCSKDQSIVSMTMARGTIGYIAPEVFSRNFGKVSSKSDVYSFGMLLLEMVGARNNDTVGNSTETYFPEWIFHRLEEGGEIAIEIEKEEDSNIAKKLTIVGLWCIGWHPVDRPSMKHVIHMLESEECPEMPPNPFKSSNILSFENDLEAIDESE